MIRSYSQFWYYMNMDILFPFSLEHWLVGEVAQIRCKIAYFASIVYLSNETILPIDSNLIYSILATKTFGIQNTDKKESEQPMSTISLIDLPVEILHRICDSLDITIILRALRYVCKRLHAVTHSYHRYKIDIMSISVSTLKFVSGQIQPEKIISLIVSTDYFNRDQRILFPSIFDMHRFTRLHSLTLLDVPNKDFRKYVQLVPATQVHWDSHEFIINGNFTKFWH